MNITTAEKLLFKVMKTIFDSGIPVSFKGSMVLKACLIEAGYDEETRHTVDIDANRPLVPTKIYEVESLRFQGVAPIQMIADKISVVSSDKVFRRIKDVVDLYYISKVFDLNVSETFETLRNSGHVLGNYDGFINRSEELRHSYEKFRFAGDVIKPGFDEVYDTVKGFLSDLLQQP